MRTQRFGDGLAALASLAPEELVQAVAVLGKGAGLKDALSSDAVSPNVKSALRSMLLSNRDVVGSDAHRTTLRHISASYTRFFGPPLVFTTPNIADTRNLMVSLMYEGADVQRWRLHLRGRQCSRRPVRVRLQLRRPRHPDQHCRRSRSRIM